jgi:hypothetical protein
MTPLQWTAYAALVGLLTACGDATSVPRTDRATISSETASLSSAPSPSVTADPSSWVTAIPATAPLDVGLPEDGGDFSVTRIRTEPDAVVLDLCGEVPISAHTVDLAGWRATGPEYEDVRQLRLYTSDNEARAAYAAVMERLPSCATKRHLERRRSTLEGDESATVVETYESPVGSPALGATFHEVVRIGNALLVTLSYGEWEPTTNLDGGIATHAREVTPIVDAMCVFAAKAC